MCLNVFLPRLIWLAHSTLLLVKSSQVQYQNVGPSAFFAGSFCPCDFDLFLKLKSALTGTRFESIEAMKEKATSVLKEMTEDNFLHCFQEWKIPTGVVDIEEKCILK